MIKEIAKYTFKTREEKLEELTAADDYKPIRIIDYNTGRSFKVWHEWLWRKVIRRYEFYAEYFYWEYYYALENPEETK